jgi:riboflavin transporter FmnP
MKPEKLGALEAQPLSSRLTFTASMGALGNVLALLSMYLAPIHPQVALDLSHIGTFLAALQCGPSLGFLAGALVALTPFYRFGVAGWYGPLLGSLIIPGKALTGLGFGIASKKLRPLIAGPIGFIPEFLYLYAFLKYITVYFIPSLANYMTDAVILSILAKAWVEIIAISLITEIILRRRILPRTR